MLLVDINYMIFCSETAYSNMFIKEHKFWANFRTAGHSPAENTLFNVNGVLL